MDPPASPGAEGALNLLILGVRPLSVTCVFPVCWAVFSPQALTFSLQHFATWKLMAFTLFWQKNLWELAGLNPRCLAGSPELLNLPDSFHRWPHAQTEQ